ncbi:DUF6204 family protein [Nonomuraea endophytica]|uniref:Uncharacterized protein n=1 Tax=Nonomuraea endophytica TaxID=714136 RepID=A0A7W8EJK7_9ACTN|nr:DUF6204 family protein [Nonomuraea endophytica]MBB5081668.1 hypothetical protein [Nonomuraea endophytica]
MFRVTVRGSFGPLDERARAAVEAAAGPAYTREGTFTHDATMAAFTFRCQVAAEDDDGEAEAGQAALEALAAHGLPYRVLKLAVTDLRQVRIRRR